MTSKQDGDDLQVFATAHNDRLIPGVDYEVATCCNCGKVEHTPEELAACIDSAVGPRQPEKFDKGARNCEMPEAHEAHMAINGECPWCGAYDPSAIDESVALCEAHGNPNCGLCDS